MLTNPITVSMNYSYVHRLESLRLRGHDLMLPACTGYTDSHLLSGLYLNFFSFTLLLFRSLFRSLEFVHLSHSLINTVLLCYCVISFFIT